MNRKFRWISILLAVAIIFSTFSFAAYAEDKDPEEAGDTPSTQGDVMSTDATEPTTASTEATEAPTQSTYESPFTAAVNTAQGTKLSWKAVEGAAGYVLYLHKGELYEEIVKTSELNYIHTPLEDGKVYLYNIRAYGSDGAFLTEFAAQDFANTFYLPPVISSLTATENGVKVKWGAVSGIERYLVYRAEDKKSWSRLAVVSDAEYLDTSAVSGTKYKYTVRCLSADGETLLSHHNDGKSISYVQTPAIKSISNTLTGAKITWNKPAGVDKCRVYYKSRSGWTRIAETSDTSYTHDKLTGGDTYVYTVRGLDSKGNFVTDFNHDGWSNMFIDAPVISSFNNTDKGVNITWNAPKGAVKYRVYYYGSKGWTKLAETTETSFLDTDVKDGGKYTYTVRCISEDSKSFTSYHTSGKSTYYVAVPSITSISNTATGARITWKRPNGVAKMRLYYLRNNQWVRLVETASESVLHDKLTGGKSYTYTIRAVDDKGNFVSEYNKTGWTNTFIEPPVISSLTNTEKGINIKWNAPEGAVKYRVYYYGSKGWTKLTETTETSFLDTDVVSGYHYTYTVRCISTDSKSFTSYHNSGKKTQYIAMPKVSSISNTETGAKITWKKPGGATKVRIYYKGDSGWTRIGETSSTSFVHDKLTSGKTYTYTLRCVDDKGNLISDFSGTGWNNMFVAPPKISAVTKSGDANQVAWKAVDGAEGYRLYRKTFGGSFARLFDGITETSYLDNTVKADTLYAYTVRSLDKDGNVVSDYFASNVFYYNGKLANGQIKIDGKTFTFENGTLRTGYQKINGKTYYYDASGNLKKNGIVGSASEGYCYADKNGVIDFTYRNGITYGGYDWLVLDGKAYKVTDEDDETLFRALKLVNRVTDSSMSKSEKLRACFDHLQNYDYVERNPRIPDYTGMDWPIIYANDIFEDDQGNCLSFAAAFAYMAKAIGYKNVYGCHSGGHGWCEIEGLIYDPEWGMHNFNYSYYGMSYDEPCDVGYASAIDKSVSWMYIKIA